MAAAKTSLVLPLPFGIAPEGAPMGDETRFFLFRALETGIFFAMGLSYAMVTGNRDDEHANGQWPLANDYDMRRFLATNKKMGFCYIAISFVMCSFLMGNQGLGKKSRAG